MGDIMHSSSACPCGSGNSLLLCCQPFLLSRKKPATAEALMRSRYAAYVTGNVAYIYETTHPDRRDSRLRQQIEAWVGQSRWLGLEVLRVHGGGSADKQGKVVFIASYEVAGQPGSLHELSRFRRFKKDWYYLDGELEGG